MTDLKVQTVALLSSEERREMEARVNAATHVELKSDGSLLVWRPDGRIDQMYLRPDVGLTREQAALLAMACGVVPRLLAIAGIAEEAYSILVQARLAQDGNHSPEQVLVNAERVRALLARVTRPPPVADVD